MKLIDQYGAVCTVRRLAPKTIRTYRRWVEEFRRFHHDRTGAEFIRKTWVNGKSRRPPAMEVPSFLSR